MPVEAIFLGRKSISARTLEWLATDSRVRIRAVVTDSHLPISPTAGAARSFGLPLLDHDELARQVDCGEIHADLGISVLYWRKLRGSLLLTDSSRGMINFHPAPLPEYKGCAGYNLAILESRTTWASTAHYVDADIDTGPIIEIAEFPIDVESETAWTLEQATLAIMQEQIRRVLDRAIVQTTRLHATPNVGGRYVSRRQMEEMKRIAPGDDVDRKARAFFFPPYDGAWVECEGQRCTVVTPSILRGLTRPGTSHLFLKPALRGEESPR